MRINLKKEEVKSMEKNIDLSIVVPCYNEEKSIPLVVQRFEEAFPKELDLELILVDNGSTDNSNKVIEDFAKQYSYIKTIRIEKNIGYGFGILSGLKEARGDVLAWTHADMQTDLKDAIVAYDEYLKYNDTNVFVKGKRKKRKFAEQFFTFGMQVIASIVLGEKLDDINAQPKLFSREFYKKHMNNAPYDFSLDLYALYFGKKYCKIVEIPVYFNKRMHGEAKGGGSFKTRIKLIKRTFNYIFELKKTLKLGRNL